MRLVLVDGHYYLYRSFFAIRNLSNSRGEPTNAIYGFLKALRKMLADVHPDLGAVLWDCGLPSRRTALQPAYKKNRPAMPAGLHAQEVWLQENIALTGVASLCLPDTEADDLIASYARSAVGEGIEVIVATNDKDILQIAGGPVSIYSTAKADIGRNSFALLGRAEVAAKWGVEPERIADVLALAGDASDNIPGVAGVGLKTASQLIREHGSLDRLLASLEAIPSASLREKLAASRDLISANRQMVALDDDLPLPQPPKSLKISPDYPRLLSALRECEFKSLLVEVEREASALQGQQELFK